MIDHGALIVGAANLAAAGAAWIAASDTAEAPAFAPRVQAALKSPMCRYWIRGKDGAQK